jgi:Lipocalin / cytosolic fatty-acid binding protein family
MSNSTTGAQVSGQFELVSVENYDELLKAMDVGFAQRALLMNTKLTLKVSIEGNQGEVITASTYKILTHRFILGQETPESLPDGRQVPSTIVVQGNTFTQTQRFDAGVCTITRVVDGNELRETGSMNGIQAIRVFKKTA